MSLDDKGVVTSVSKVYRSVNTLRGPEWYDYTQFTPKWGRPDRYFLVQKVGRGKYSTVFRAFYKKRRECAIKILVPLDPKRYLKEIKILVNLSGGPNIVKLLDLVKDPMTEYYSYVFEWVDFHDWRSMYQKFTVDDARFYLFKLLQAINYAHQNGIMHRDIKPQNIAIDPKTKSLKLLDWGLADFYVPLRRYNSHVATRTFKPPELLIDYPYYDYSLDIWCTGLTFGAMLFKRIPVESSDSDLNQLYNVADLVGGRAIVEYAESLMMGIRGDVVEKLMTKKGTGFAPFIARAGRENCPPDAIDLLARMLTVDHRDRITAQEAMRHRFFNPIRNQFREY